MPEGVQDFEFLHSWRRVMPMLPHQPTEPAPSRARRPRRGLGAVAGLGMLAMAGAVVALTPAERIASGLMTSSSALAAETSAPPAVAMPSFADLVERLKPSVVSVYVDAEIGNVGQSLGRGQQGEEFQGQNPFRSEEHTSELQSLRHLVCR